MAAATKVGKTARSTTKTQPKTNQGQIRQHAYVEMDLQQILKATTNGEESCTDKDFFYSQREDFKEITNSSLNI